jgi:hypothetical protein
MIRPRRPAALTTAALLCCVALAGCSTAAAAPARPIGTPSPRPATSRPAPTDDMPPPATVLATTLKVADKASAVHIKGTLSHGTSSITVDIQLDRDGDSSGTVTGVATVGVRLVDHLGYVQLTKHMIEQIGRSPTSEVGRQMLNKWLPASSKLFHGVDLANAFQALAFGTYLPTAFDDELPDVTPDAGYPETVDGIPTLDYDYYSGDLYVAIADPHYPIELAVDDPDLGVGRLIFTGWNQPARVAAPTAAQLYHGPGA